MREKKVFFFFFSLILVFLCWRSAQKSHRCAKTNDTKKEKSEKDEKQLYVTHIYLNLTQHFEEEKKMN